MRERVSVAEGTEAPVSFGYVWLEGAALALILLLAAYLRLANSASNPGWYSDEGTLVNIAENMLRGRVQDFALIGSTLLAARLPLYPLLASLAFRLAGPGIPTLRLLSGSLGVTTCFLLYAVIRNGLGRSGAVSGLASAFVLAIHPTAVIYSRMGFSYNLIAPLVLIEVWGAWVYLAHGDRRALAVAALAVGLGCVTDIMGAVFLVLLGIIVSLRRARDLTWSIGLAFIPPAVYVASMLASNAPAFLFDLQFTLDRLGAVPLWAQPGLLAFNLASLVRGDPWFALGIVGIFMLHPVRWRWLVILSLFFPMIAVGRSTGLAGLRTYYLIPIFPLIAVGVAGLLVAGIPVVRRTLEDSIGRAFERWGWRQSVGTSGRVRRRLITLGVALGVFGIVLAPLLISIVQSVGDVQSGFRTPADDLSIDPGEARAVAEFINDRTGPDDLIIASPAFGWQLVSNVIELEQAVALAGGETVDYPDDVPVDRFAYKAGLHDVDYVVIDRVWDRWAAPFMPDVRELQDEVERWPLALSLGEFRVYRNPSG